ncbi:helix-turn-helix domain-containing protein, partial [Limosilactobacillus ingluviei]|uniref:helix-turn-helix domain-containing protein n=1 Tax=Limosilactobacillus ingluviei TaxID=148604 RepID=UPI000A9A4313
MVNKAYKIRLYPTPDQQVLLARTFGCMRWFWNQMLAMHISRYANNPKAKFIN